MCRPIIAATLVSLLAAGLGAHAAHGTFGGAAAPAASPAKVKYLAAGGIALPAGYETFTGGGLAADADGNVYFVVAYQNAWVVAVFGPDRMYKRTLTLSCCTTGRSGPRVAIGPDGLLYIAATDGGDNRVNVYTREGAFVRRLDATSVGNPADLELDADRNVYAINGSTNELVRMNPAGERTGRWTLDGALRGVAVAPDGTMWVTVFGRSDGRQLLHLSADGKELAGAPRLETIVPNKGLSTSDVDFANARLYIAGKGLRGEALAVVTPSGELVDLICCAANVGPVAVHGEDVYVAGLEAQSARALQAARFDIGHLEGRSVRVPLPEEGYVYASGCHEIDATSSHPVPTVVVPGSRRECGVVFENLANPCGAGRLRTNLGDVYLGGQRLPLGRNQAQFFTPAERPYVIDPKAFAGVELPPGIAGSGSVVVSYLCNHNGTVETIYEWKGQIELLDPSGTVLDRTTGRPVDAATVLLESSVAKGGPFGRPGLSGIRPQVNPQLTRRRGIFAWDVAEGFWRLRVAAFGYRAFTSPVYHVPPAVTGLQLKLRRDARTQARLIDPYEGRVGAFKLGARVAETKRVAGLRIRIKNGRVRAIRVLAKRFRTARGITLGSREIELADGYPTAPGQAARQRAAQPSRYRVGKATFTIRRGRVVAITLGR